MEGGKDAAWRSMWAAPHKTNPPEVSGYREWPTLPTEKVILHGLSLLRVAGHQVSPHQSLEKSEEQHHIGVVDDGHVPPAQHLLGAGRGGEGDNMSLHWC